MNIAVLPVSVALAASVALMMTGRTSAQPKGAQLTPTAHAALPSAPSDFWLVPSETDSAARQGTRYEALAEEVAESIRRRRRRAKAERYR